MLDETVHLLEAARATTVLVDGRSGSGKSVLATQLSRGWAGSLVVRLDDIYPGWDGLMWASEHVSSALLAPRTEGRPGRWRSWDWAAGRVGGWHSVAPARRLIVEGVGVLSAANRALADLGIWVEAADADRKRRALRRDGDTYRPHWDRWAAQEAEFIARHDPQANADLIAMPASGRFTLTTAQRTQ